MKGKPTIQNIGYFLVHGVKILCLFRTKPRGDFPHIVFKLRKSGNDGNFFSMESAVLEQNPDILEKFINGEQIRM